MLEECIIIFILLVFAAFGMLKSRRSRWFIAILPLLVIPFVNVAVNLFCSNVLNITLTIEIMATAITLALVISCTWLGFLTATLLGGRKYKITYLFGCIAFDVILALVILADYYKTLA